MDRGSSIRSLRRKLATLGGWIGPKYSPEPLRAAVERRLGAVTIDTALRDLVVTSYDMTGREPYFFKRWRARQSPHRNPQIADAALATSAAPTYFPAHRQQGRALIDGGVFASNPVIAAIVEALKRSRDEPASLTRDDLLVVSVGTGSHEIGFKQSEASGWGKAEDPASSAGKRSSTPRSRWTTPAQAPSGSSKPRPAS